MSVMIRAMQYNIHVDAALSSEITLEDVRGVFDGRGWRWVQQIPRKELQFHEEIWSTGHEAGAARYIYDHFVDIPVIRMETNQPGIVFDWVGELAEELPLFNRFGLAVLGEDPDVKKRAFAIRGLAAVVDEFQSDIFEIFTACVVDELDEMRGLALTCIARMPWFRFAEVLESVAKSETVDVLRAEQLRLAADIRENGIRG